VGDPIVIPFLDLKAQYKQVGAEIEAAVLETLASTQFILGGRVAAFEEAFAAYCASPHAIGVNSGTSALHIALAAADIGPGDEVITVSCTFVATAAAIHYTGARPVFVDVDPQTLTMDPALIEGKITERTRAIIPVHLHGQMADMDPIMEIAGRHGLLVIEDAAQAHGAEYKGRRAGSIGDLGCFSFYPGKNLGACGEGGAVVTANGAYADKIRMLRDWGQESKYHHTLKGFNYRMDGVQGAALGVKLKYLEEWTEARRRHAGTYGKLLTAQGIATPVQLAHNRHVYHVYAVRVAQRDRVQARLGDVGVATGIHYPIPVHLQKAYADPAHRPGDFPVTEQASAEMLSLPMFPELTEAQLQQTCQALAEAL